LEPLQKEFYKSIQEAGETGMWLALTEGIA
jgi:hypothetical protein